MEKLEVEIPVSAGDKVYRTTTKCGIIEGMIEVVEVKAKSLIQDTSAYTKVISPAKNNIYISIVVKWQSYRDYEYYNPSDMGTKIFLSKEELIKHLVGML